MRDWGSEVSGACIDYADDVANLERARPEVGFVFAGFVFCINMLFEKIMIVRVAHNTQGWPPNCKVGISIIYTFTYSCKEIVNKTRLCPLP